LTLYKIRLNVNGILPCNWDILGCMNILILRKGKRNEETKKGGWYSGLRNTEPRPPLRPPCTRHTRNPNSRTQLSEHERDTEGARTAVDGDHRGGSWRFTPKAPETQALALPVDCARQRRRRGGWSRRRGEIQRPNSTQQQQREAGSGSH